MKALLILAGLVAAATASTKFSELIVEEWDTYKVTHNKSFNNDFEDKIRMKIFIKNRIDIAKHNKRYARGQVSFALEVNHFSDFTTREFVDLMNGFNRTARKGGVTFAARAAQIPRSTFVSPRAAIPDSIDWRKKGAVTPVKNQGQCGSCYSFSTTGSLEGQTFIKTGRLISLSEQNILDCSKSYGNEGCSGGLMDNAFSYIRDNKGLDTEVSYPYEAKDEATCNYNPRTKGAVDTGLVDIPAGDEAALQDAVANIGPISVAIDAGHQSMMAYKSGIYFEPECSDQNLDHAVLIVGYGTDEKGDDYWIVKNSWGPQWGEDGYIRMARNKGNHCGIASQASYPVV